MRNSDYNSNNNNNSSRHHQHSPSSRSKGQYKKESYSHTHTHNHNHSQFSSTTPYQKLHRDLDDNFEDVVLQRHKQQSVKARKDLEQLMSSRNNRYERKSATTSVGSVGGNRSPTRKEPNNHSKGFGHHLSSIGDSSDDRKAAKTTFHKLSATNLQQQQIEDLQKKVDIILMHNEKLCDQNQRFKVIINDLTEQNKKLLRRNEYLQEQIHIQSSNTARFRSEEHYEILINKLRKELQTSSKGYERKLDEAYEAKSILKEQLQTLSRIIEDLSFENQDMKKQIHENNLKEEMFTFNLKEQYIREHQEIQNKLKDQFLIKQVQWQREKESIHRKHQIEKLNMLKQFQSKKAQEIKQAKEKLKKVEDTNKQEVKKVQQRLAKTFTEEKQKIKKNHEKQVQQQKDKATVFIRQVLDNVEENTKNQNKQYEQEIEQLKDSLDSRKKLIQLLLDQRTKEGKRPNKNQSSSNRKQSHNDDNDDGRNYDNNNDDDQPQNNWYEQMIRLKEQLREVTNQFLREQQLLKLKMAEKHQIDINEMKKIYEDKMELMSLHNERVDEQNTRLRDMYQSSLNQKVQQKKQFQLQTSKLKNYVRKLRVELNGIQQEFRINIDGIKDQNNTFSMTMMKSMVEVKDRANFYQEQNRKLRQSYDEHEREVQQSRKQSEEKIKYLENKYDHLHEKLTKVVQDYSQKLITLQTQSEQRQNHLRESLDKEHQMIQTIVQAMKKDINDLKAQNKALKNKNHDLQCTVKEKNQDISSYKSKIQQLDADIERLKMDLQMSGVNDKDKEDTIKQWKDHYEKLIADLEYDKQLDRGKLQQKQEQLIEIVKRYNQLESQLSKAMQKMKKRSIVDKKVLEIGLDVNLVKNMGELFASQNRVAMKDISESDIMRSNGANDRQEKDIQNKRRLKTTDQKQYSGSGGKLY